MLAPPNHHQNPREAHLKLFLSRHIGDASRMMVLAICPSVLVIENHLSIYEMDMVSVASVSGLDGVIGQPGDQLIFLAKHIILREFKRLQHLSLRGNGQALRKNPFLHAHLDISFGVEESVQYVCKASGLTLLDELSLQTFAPCFLIFLLLLGSRLWLGPSVRQPF